MGKGSDTNPLAKPHRRQFSGRCKAEVLGTYEPVAKKSAAARPCAESPLQV